MGIGRVGGVKHPGGSVRIGDGRTGPVTMLLRELLARSGQR
ncbi:MAG TPA: hypothetical protein VK735_09190 [Pseudonocardia sp.]|nr:hypothetical protein [Pseudonocardia sp.]HTF47608.1 hypothetical protein [Pseudonocardia sp.]